MKMLIRPLSFLLALAIAASFSSCECAFSKVGCAPDNYTAQLRIVRGGTGEDLLFGPNRMYDASRIKFFSAYGSDTTFFDSHAIPFASYRFDSILVVDFGSKPSRVFMRLGNGDTDTLNVSYGSEDRKCCSMYNYISQIKYNDFMIVAGDQGPQELTKRF